MQSLVYANANSLFDYSNGAARSIRLLLEAVASSGIKVFAITSCVSDSRDGFLHSRSIWSEEHNHTSGNHPLIQRFNRQGVRHTLILCEDHQRQSMTSQVEELIYRETELILDSLKRSSDSLGFLSWGNLLLEEALYRRARGLAIPTFFYLANPSYLHKQSFPLKMATTVFTDSKATQNLYREQVTAPIKFLPKIIAPSNNNCTAEDRHSKQTITLINPSINKGLKQAIEVARTCQQQDDAHQFVLIDAAGKLDRDLKMIRLNRDDLPCNVLIRPGTSNIDSLLADTSILLLLSIWHESGSRLIHEGHQRGIPVLAFATGGTPEYLEHAPDDLFQPPLQNSNWDCSKLVARINTLLYNVDIYRRHFEHLINHANQLEKSNRVSAIKIVQQAISNS